MRFLFIVTRHQQFCRPPGKAMQRVGYLAELALHDGKTGVVETTPADRLRQVGSVKSHLDRFALDPLSLFGTDLPSAFHLDLKRKQFLGNESLNGIGQHPLFTG